MKIITNSKSSQIFFQLIADIIAIWLGFTLQLYMRFYSGLMETLALPNTTDYIIGNCLMTFYWVPLFAMMGMYKNWQVLSPFSEFFTIIKTTFLGCLIIVFLILSDSASSFKGTFVIYFAISSIFFICFRFIARRIQVALRRKRIITIPTLVIGDFEHSVEFYEKTLINTTWGIDVLGIILHKPLTEDEIDTINENGIDSNIFIGTVDKLSELFDSNSYEDIVISTGTPNSKLLFAIENACINKPTKILISPNLYDHFTGRTKAQNLYGIPLIEVSSHIIKPYQAVIKRSFDIAFSILVIILGAPFWLLIAIAIRLESEGKIIYSQQRVGRYNKVYTMYKFRSMVQSECTDDDNPTWTKVGDARVTKFGKFIRKAHIDEIPQFYNVLIGDMSVVGPRPEQTKLVNEFTEQLPYYSRRHSVRPGITGWWQVKYKQHVMSLDEVKNRTKDDFYYIENFSLQLDFEILVRTVWCVLSGHGQA